MELLIFVVWLSLMSTTYSGTSPSNDDCESAAVLDSIDMTRSDSTIGATTDDDLADCGVAILSPGVWYTFAEGVVAPLQIFTISTCSANTDFDTKISLFSGSCGSLVCESGNDDAFCDSGSQKTSTIEFQPAVADTFYIYVHGFESTVGDFDLIISAGIRGDICAGAYPVPTNLLPLTIRGQTTFATTDADIPDCPNTANTSPGVWYSLQGTDNLLAVSTCGSPDGYDPLMRVYSGDCESLVCVADNDDDEDNCFFSNDDKFESRVNFQAEEGVTYFIFLNGFGTSTVVFDLRIIPLNNDECEGAELLTFNGQQSVSRTADTSLATRSTHPSCSRVNSIAPGLWYAVEGTGGNLQASTCDEQTQLDSQILVFEGPCQTLNCVFANAMDSTCDVYSGFSTVRWFGEVGVTYYIKVRGSDYPEPQFGTFRLTVSELGVPNDDCLSAQLLTLGELVVGDSRLANTDIVTACSGLDTYTAGVWYTIFGTGSVLEATTCANINFDSQLAVMLNVCDNLDCQGYNDDDCILFAESSTVTWSSDDGVQYYIFVNGFTKRAEFNLIVTEIEELPTDPPTDAPSHSCCFSQGLNRDIPGIGVGGVNLNTLEECEEECCNTDGCVAVQFSATAFAGEPNQCVIHNTQGYGPAENIGDYITTLKTTSCPRECDFGSPIPYDIPGLGLGGFFSVSVAACRQLCCETSTCKAFQFSSSVAFGPEVRCILHDNQVFFGGVVEDYTTELLYEEGEVRSETCSSTFLSGISIDLPGLGIGGFPVPSLSACKNICCSTPACKAVQFSQSGSLGADIQCVLHPTIQVVAPAAEGYLVYSIGSGLPSCTFGAAIPIPNDIPGVGLGGVPASSLQECQNICCGIPACVAIQFSDSSTLGPDMRCVLHASQGIVQSSVDGYSTFLVPNAARQCTYAAPLANDIPGTGMGGFPVTTLEACRTLCCEQPGCKAIQFSQGAALGEDIQCVLHATRVIQGSAVEDYLVYLIDDAGNSPVGCTAWSSGEFGDIPGLGLGGFSENSLAACRQLCCSTVGCKAIQFSPSAPFGADIQCVLHSSSQAQGPQPGDYMAYKLLAV